MQGSICNIQLKSQEIMNAIRSEFLQKITNVTGWHIFLIYIID